MRPSSLLLLALVGLGSTYPPLPTVDDAVYQLGKSHRCDWTSEEVIAIADEVKAIAVRTPLSCPDVIGCLGRLIMAIRNQDKLVPDVPTLLHALGQVVDLQVARVF